MLLIAIPKSASTSLAMTISKISKIDYRLGIPKINIDIDSEDFTELQRYHDNMIERSPLFLNQCIKGRKILFKEHLLPTLRHLEILRKINGKIVILLRKPEDVLDCYKRHDINHYKIHGKHIDLDRIYEDVKLFHDRYMFWASNKKNAIVIYYRDLVLNYVPTIKKVLKHYGLNYKNVMPLLRAKYTGVGKKRIEDAVNCNS